jgi:foldase protein PrsA
MRTYLEQSALQQGFSEWINNYKSSANIVVNDMPEGLPYNVDLTGVEAPALDHESLLDGAEVVDDDGADGEAIEVEVDDAESSQASE